MSKQKRENQVQVSIVGGQQTADSINGQADDATSQASRSSWLMYLKTHWWAVAIIAFLSLGTLGAGLRYLENDAKRQQMNQTNLTADLKNQTFLNRLNPFIPAPLPSPTPQLAKEYVYAGSRLLAVEDANANAALSSDLAIFRPSTGDWWILGGTSYQVTVQQYGTNGDMPVPGDYDGDGKTDFSIWRPSNSSWHVFYSGNGSYFSFNYGQAGDQPLVADFDGDGKTDFTLFRPSNKTWYVNRSSDLANIYVQEFGLNGDIPAPADYDGDGRADHAVWQPNSQNFVVLRSSDGQLQFSQLGVPAAGIPICADYDGDGRADYTIKSGNNWIIKQSSNNQTNSITWQQAGDIAVQNDYDGDGKVDIAVWRNATGYWYIKNSADNSTRTVQWGQANDIPVPAFYRR